MTTDEMLDKKKNIVSMRLDSNERLGVQKLASRLYVRESDIYRFAINYILNKTSKFNYLNHTGSDLLPLFIKFNEELKQNFNLKKQHLFKIINYGNANPDKFVGMHDIELLLMPDYLLGQTLSQIKEAQPFKEPDSKVWLENYLCSKYNKFEMTDENDEKSS
jgi:hypothetical protein